MMPTDDLTRLRTALATEVTPDWPVTTEWAKEQQLTYGRLRALVAEVDRLRERLVTSELLRMEDGFEHGQEMLAHNFSVARRCYQSIYRLMTIDDEQKRPLGDAYHQGLADAATVVDTVAKVCKRQADGDDEEVSDGE